MTGQGGQRARDEECAFPPLIDTREDAGPVQWLDHC